MMLRPRTLEGGDLAWLFPVLNLYATVDKLFAKYEDKTVSYIYAVGAIDTLFVFFLFAFFSSKAQSPYFAVLAICRSASVATKTLLYLLYSWEHILPAWRWPVAAMNGQWIILPVFVILSISKRLNAALKVPPGKEA